MESEQTFIQTVNAQLCACVVDYHSFTGVKTEVGCRDDSVPKL